ncbi:conserved hypothetical protein [gamma proteobacterium HdN1]|nr:conserved hypothetical protein [gamma proteobacterium HdN1]
MSQFILDERLQRDTLEVAESPLSLLRMFNDSRYFWLILIPKIHGAVELHTLPPSVRVQLTNETMLCSEAIANQPNVSKINTGALGNIVRQLHVHIVGRNPTDPAWPGPVWGHSLAVPLSISEHSERVQILKNSVLGADFCFDRA